MFKPPRTSIIYMIGGLFQLEGSRLTQKRSYMIEIAHGKKTINTGDGSYIGMT